MLTLFAITDPKEAAKYYEADNYYVRGSAEAVAATHWWGKGTEELGLSGYVFEERFTELLSGRLSESDVLGRKRKDGGVKHKPGYDLTFSAPKSVSILAEIGRDQRIYEAHNFAVNAALGYLEKNVAKYRETHDSITEVKSAENLIVAKFRHDTSRSVDQTIDCQLHTHCVVMNAVKSKDAKWRSLHERSLFDFKMTGGMIYRAALAKQLKLLGYRVEKTREDGLFEIGGFERSQIEEFSKRRVKILEVMREKGLYGSESAQKVALSTRESKYEVDRDDLLKHWQKRAQDIGLKLDEEVACTKVRKSLLSVDETRTKEKAIASIAYAIEHLGERSSVFYEKDLIKTSLQHGLGDVGIENVHSAISHAVKSNSLYELGSHKEQPIYTSPKVVEREQEIITVAKNGKGIHDSIASQEATSLYLSDFYDKSSKETKPTKCQLKAIEFLATSKDIVACVQGYAGTGKTTMLRAICQLAEKAGYELRGAAPSASAADVLRADTAIKTDTLSALLIDLERRSVSPEKPELIILDEASMASTSQMYRLLKLSEESGSRIFLVGDRMQLPAVEAGDPFRLLQDEGASLVSLEEVVRQKAGDLKWAVKETISGDTNLAISAIGNEVFSSKPTDGEAFRNPQSLVIENEDKEARLANIANEYLSLTPQERAETIILLGSNEDRQLVNAQIRTGLSDENSQEEGVQTLSSKNFTSVEKRHISNFSVGDIIRFNKSYRSIGVKRFEYLKIVKIDRENKELIFKSNFGEIRWNPESAANIKGDAIEVFEEQVRQIRSGDIIRWTQNKKSLNIFNSETAEVLSVEGKLSEIKLRNGETVKLDLTKRSNCHWDYAWSSTIYAAQGKKARNVIAQLEGKNPNLTNYRSFYVTLSRAVDRISLYVDDLKKATETIKNFTGSKSNASDFIESFCEQKRFSNDLNKLHEKTSSEAFVSESLNARLKALANQYVGLLGKGRCYLVVPDFKDRKELNHLVRDELKNRNLLSPLDYAVNSLREVRIRQSQPELSFKKGMVVRFDRGFRRYDLAKGSYCTLDFVDQLQGNITLKRPDGTTLEASMHELCKQQGRAIRIYKTDRIQLSEGERVFWTKSFSDLDVREGSLATIKSIEKGAFTFELESGHEFSINHSDNRLKHLVYAYSNSFSNKPAKKPDYVLTHLDERVRSIKRVSAVLGLLGSAKRSAYVYTHSCEYLSDKAIEASAGNILFKAKLLSPVEHDKIFKKNDWESEVESKGSRKASKSNSFSSERKKYWDKDQVLLGLLPKAEQIVSSLILEDKNIRKSNAQKIVWGMKNGSVHLHLSGEKAGLINDYERNIHGDLITFYAKSRGLDWYDALTELAETSGINPDMSKKMHVPITPENLEAKSQALLKEQKRKASALALAKKTWSDSSPVKGTIAEKYLKHHRGATFDLGKVEMRFNEKAPVYMFDENGKLKVFARKPAMLVKFENSSGEITGVQCTYLDPNSANKDKSSKVVKSTIGSQWGSSGLIYLGGNEKIIVAEGAETAMSLIEAEPRSSIYITGGNMQNIQHYERLVTDHGKSEIQIAADNDLSRESGSWKSTEAGAKSLFEKGITVSISQPTAISGKKTDFNDVYKRYGAGEVEKQIKPQFELNSAGVISRIGKALKVPAGGDEDDVKSDNYRLPQPEFLKIKNEAKNLNNKQI